MLDVKNGEDYRCAIMLCVVGRKAVHRVHVDVGHATTGMHMLVMLREARALIPRRHSIGLSGGSDNASSKAGRFVSLESSALSTRLAHVSCSARVHHSAPTPIIPPLIPQPRTLTTTSHVKRQQHRHKHRVPAAGLHSSSFCSPHVRLKADARSFRSRRAPG